MAKKAKAAAATSGEGSKATAADGRRVRNRGVRQVRVGDILVNPHNFRTHDVGQREALQGAVATLGWYGYPDVFEHPDHPGKVMLVDGELRTDHLLETLGPDGLVEVNLTDFTPAEADLALATKDPISALAGTDGRKLEDLLAGLGETDARLGDLLGTLKDQAFEALTATLAEGSAVTAGDATEGTAGESAPDPAMLGKGYKALTALLTESQHDTVIGAVNAAKERHKLDTTAEALAVICREWVDAVTTRDAEGGHGTP